MGKWVKTIVDVRVVVGVMEVVSGCWMLVVEMVLIVRS